MSPTDRSGLVGCSDDIDAVVGEKYEAHINDYLKQTEELLDKLVEAGDETVLRFKVKQE
ncbi:hypothetical protein GQ473_05285 [archaeon]|nr:hypothetical protein [archaeon]